METRRNTSIARQGFWFDHVEYAKSCLLTSQDQAVDLECYVLWTVEQPPLTSHILVSHASLSQNMDSRQRKSNSNLWLPSNFSLRTPKRCTLTKTTQHVCFPTHHQKVKHGGPKDNSSQVICPLSHPNRPWVVYPLPVFRMEGFASQSTP